MSLTYDLTKIKDWGTLCYTKDDNGNDILNPVTHAMIFIMLETGVREITEKNAEELAWRIRLARSISENGTTRDPNLDQIKQHIGMRVNVTPLTLAKYMSNLRNAWKHRR
jgi:hypothetical protein